MSRIAIGNSSVGLEQCCFFVLIRTLDQSERETSFLEEDLRRSGLIAHVPEMIFIWRSVPVES